MASYIYTNYENQYSDEENSSENKESEYNPNLYSEQFDDEAES